MSKMSNMDKVFGINKHYSILKKIAKEFPNRTFGFFQFMNNKRKEGIYETTNFRSYEPDINKPNPQPGEELFIAYTWAEAYDLLSA